MSISDKKYEDLNTNLAAVGMAVFVNFYYDFKDASMPIEDLAQKIFTQNPTSKSASQNFRIPRARHIFQTGQQLDALKIIIQSNRVDAKARELAKHILQEESQRKDEAEDIYQELLFINELNEEMVYLQMESSPIPQYDNAPRNPKGDKILISTHYQRDRKTSENALRMALYLCEVNNNHFVFRRKNGIVNYTEPHHLVPLSAREDFPDVDLDREQNIISLCSNCHNQLHYGSDIGGLLRPLYEKRKELLESIGIIISFEQLLKYY